MNKLETIQNKLDNGLTIMILFGLLCVAPSIVDVILGPIV